jgi:hypothetical protein
MTPRRRHDLHMIAIGIALGLLALALHMLIWPAP